MTDPHRALKTAFSRYATGVTVVGCQDGEGRAVGLTVNSFTSVSLDPPLVLWCVDRHSALFDVFAAAPSYAVSVLAEGADAVSTRFASPGQHLFQDDESEARSTGAPLLKGRLAGFDCKVVSRHEAGDHMVLVGQVVDYDSVEGTPLLYVNSSYGAVK